MVWQVAAMGRSDEAIDQYKKALAINPAYVQARHTVWPLRW